MGIRFRKRIKIAPGVYINLNKKGVSVTGGVRGAHVTVGKRGTTTSVGVPGTGLSYVSHSPAREQHHETAPSPERPERASHTVVLLVIFFGLMWLMVVLGK